MIIAIGDTKKEEAGWIASYDARFSEYTKKPKELHTHYDELTNLKDKTVTLVGHTDDTYATVGGQDAEKIAKKLRESYAENPHALEEIFLVSCESSKPISEEGWLYGSTEKPCFAQQLADELHKQGFTQDIKVYSVQPPEDAYAIRVKMDKDELLRGRISAVAYMNQYTADYEDCPAGERRAKNLKFKKADHQKKIIMEASKGSHQDSFRVAFKPYTPGGVKVETCFSKKDYKDYLKKLLDKQGIFTTLFYAIYGTRDFVKQMAEQLFIIETQEKPALQGLENLKKEIPPPSSQGLLSHFTSDKWKSIREYLALDKNSTQEKRDAVWKTIDSHCDQKIYSEIKRYHEQLKQANERKTEVKKQLLRTIDDYLEKYKNADDEMHVSKRNVMEAMRSYIQMPNKTTWENLQDNASDKMNPGWSKGFFSQVSDMKEKIEIMHDHTSHP